VTSRPSATANRCPFRVRTGGYYDGDFTSLEITSDYPADLQHALDVLRHA